MIVTKEAVEAALEGDTSQLREERDQNLAQFVVVAVDETRNWSLPKPDVPGSCLGIYLVDLNRPVHICSLTPSYELVFLYDTYAGEVPENAQALSESYSLGDDMYLNSVSGLRQVPVAQGSVSSTDDLEETYDRRVESLKEYCQGNHLL